MAIKDNPDDYVISETEARAGEEGKPLFHVLRPYIEGCGRLRFVLAWCATRSDAEQVVRVLNAARAVKAKGTEFVDDFEKSSELIEDDEEGAIEILAGMEAKASELRGLLEAL